MNRRKILNWLAASPFIGFTTSAFAKVSPPIITKQPIDCDTLHIYGSSYYPAIADDYTVHIVAGVDYKNDVYLLDSWRKPAPRIEAVEKLCDLIEKWKPLGWAEEERMGGLGPLIHKMMVERDIWIVRAQFPASRKQDGAQLIKGHVAKWFRPWPFDYEDIRYETASALSLLGLAIGSRREIKEQQI